MKTKWNNQRTRPTKPREAPDRAGILSLIHGGDIAAARHFAQTQVDRFGRAPELLQPMGEILLRLGHSTEALTWLEAACAAQPEDLDAWNQRAVALSRLLHFEKAHQIYEKILPFAPQVPALFTNIGRNLNRARRFQEAEHWLRQGLALDASALGLQINLADALIGQERTGEARDVVAALLQKGSQDTDVLRVHATLLYAAGQLPEAEALVHQLLEQHPKSTRLRLLLCLILGGLGRTDEQILLMQELLATDPSLDAVQSSLVFTLNYSAQADVTELLIQAQRYGTTLQTQQAARDEQPFSHWRMEPHPAHLRVGLVS